MSGLLLGIVLSVCICWFHNMVTVPPWILLFLLLLLLLLLLLKKSVGSLTYFVYTVYCSFRFSSSETDIIIIIIIIIIIKQRG